MNSVDIWALWLLGFKRREPKTRLGRYARTSKRTLTVIALIYLTLLAFPQVLFAHSGSAGGATSYSRSPLPPETSTRISEITDRISPSELAVAGRSERTFLCNSAALFRGFAPLNADAFAASFPGTDHVFVAQADLARNVARSRTPEHNRRTFTPVAAHEITHGLIRHRLGLLRGAHLANWVADGYCDYVPQESRLPDAEGLTLLRSGGEHPSSSFRYFKHREMVRYLVEDRERSFLDVVVRADDAAAVETETVNALRAAIDE